MKTINNNISSTVDRYMSLPYTIIMHRDEDGDMVASIKELSGCMAHGQDANEALEILAEFQRAWIERRIESGHDVPLPEGDEDLPSGKWVQRVPRSLHLQLAKQAEAEGVSLNQLVTSLLAQQVTSRAVVRAVEGIARRSGPSARRDAHGYFADIGDSTKRAPSNAIPVNFLQWAHPGVSIGKEAMDVRDSKDKLYYYEDEFSYDA